MSLICVPIVYRPLDMKELSSSFCGSKRILKITAKRKYVYQEISSKHLKSQFKNSHCTFTFSNTLFFCINLCTVESLPSLFKFLAILEKASLLPTFSSSHCLVFQLFFITKLFERIVSTCCFHFLYLTIPPISITANVLHQVTSVWLTPMVTSLYTYSNL